MAVAAGYRERFSRVAAFGVRFRPAVAEAQEAAAARAVGIDARHRGDPRLGAHGGTTGDPVVRPLGIVRPFGVLQAPLGTVG